MTVAEINGRKIAFPEAKTLADLFEEIKPSQGDAPIVASFPSWEAGTWSDRTGRKKCYVQGWLSVQGDTYRAFHVKPRPEVIEFVRTHMLHGAYDRIYFEANVWDDGRVLVRAQYNQISGSAYLAIIDGATLPE